MKPSKKQSKPVRTKASKDLSDFRVWLFATESAHPSSFCSTPNKRHSDRNVGFLPDSICLSLRSGRAGARAIRSKMTRSRPVARSIILQKVSANLSALGRNEALLETEVGALFAVAELDFVLCQEGADFFHEPGPGGFVLEDEMVLAI